MKFWSVCSWLQHLMDRALTYSVILSLCCKNSGIFSFPWEYNLSDSMCIFLNIQCTVLLGYAMEGHWQSWEVMEDHGMSWRVMGRSGKVMKTHGMHRPSFRQPGGQLPLSHLCIHPQDYRWKKPPALAAGWCPALRAWVFVSLLRHFPARRPLASKQQWVLQPLLPRTRGGRSFKPVPERTLSSPHSPPPHFTPDQSFLGLPLNISPRNIFWESLSLERQGHAVHICNGILLSLKKEGNNTICSNLDRPGKDHTKWS